jgi:hypothetical protein
MKQTMKVLYKKNLLLVGLLASLLLSCKDDFLEKQPLNQISENSVWKDLNLVEAFVNNIYTGLPNGYNRGYYMLAAGTDEADATYQWTQAEFFTRGDYTAGQDNYPVFGIPWDEQNSTGPWGLNYRFIRRANIFLNRINEVPGDQSRKDRLTGEVKFLRALFYHELTKLYGGVPIITQAQTTEDISALLTPRNSYEECVAFMVKELDEAAALLPNTTYKGRAVQGSAKALKGRVLLYAKNWTESAAASKEVIDAGPFALFPDYGALFLAANTSNSEVIFDNQFKIDRRFHPVDLFNNPAGGTGGGWGGTAPTQNLVDMYELTDGKLYNESPLYVATDPYKNLDPRFYASIQYEGAKWGDYTVETRVRGQNGIDGGATGTNADATKTGYYMRKFLDESNINRLYANGNSGPSYNSWIIIRLAEVLLNYAEAQNEAAGPDATVYDAINQVRGRPSVKMPALPAGLSQEQMRERIRRERAVELAFEEHRFYDVRRWGLGEQIFNAPIYGMRISQDGKTFTRFKVEDRVFQPKHYLMPIPQTEIDKNPNLQQNPGW